MDINKILTADYLDILFEGRNKSYGSYEMRKQYRRRVLTAGAISILVIGGLFASLLIKSKDKVVEKIVPPTVHVADLKQPPPLDEKKPPPPPPPTAPPPPLKTAIKFTPPVIKKNEEVKEVDQPKEMKKQENAVVGLANVKGSDDPNAINPNLSNVSGTGSGPVVEPTPAKDIIYRNVEQQPEFDGDVTKYIASRINYPAAARAENIQGRVTLSFVLNEDGTVSNVKIERDIGGGCGEEAKRVVSKLKWKHPGRQNGHPVKMYYILNVAFAMQ